MPSAPAMVRPPMMAGQAGRDHAAEDEEQHDATSGMAATSARFWSSPMVPVSSLASGLQAGELDRCRR